MQFEVFPELRVELVETSSVIHDEWAVDASHERLEYFMVAPVGVHTFGVPARPADELQVEARGVAGGVAGLKDQNLLLLDV